MKTSLFAGVLTLFIIGMATLTVAGSNPPGSYYELMNLDNNTTYVVKIIASANTAQVGDCIDEDGGVYPYQVGVITAHTINPVSHRTLPESISAGLEMREFACGYQIYAPQLPAFQPTKAYAMIYDPNYNGPYHALP